MKVLDMANAARTDPGASDVLVTWTLVNDNYCIGKTPCYQQTAVTIPYLNPNIWALEYCSTWCSPTAVWIIFWYYANRWYKLFPSQTTNSSWTPWWNNTWTSNASKNVEISNVINTIWRYYIWTYCDRDNNGNLNWEGTTKVINIQNAKDYPKLSVYWYTGTTSVYNPSVVPTALFNWIKTEINNNRPAVLSIARTNDRTKGHSAVIFGYKSGTTNSNVVRVNLWLGKIIWWQYNYNWVLYPVYATNIDYNLASIDISNISYEASAYTTFEIK
jgi:hypothetical protein